MARFCCAWLPQEERAGSRKSSAARGVPWCSSWKNECWRIVARLAPDHRRGLALDRLAIQHHATCRCSPSRAAADRPGSAAGDRRRAAPRASAGCRKLMFQTPSSPMSAGRLSLPGRAAEMLVHLVAAARGSRRKLSRADGDGERHADRGPHRVAAADPVPHLEAVVRMHAELIHRLVVDRHGREVLAAPPARPACLRARRARCARWSGSRAS